jgi:fructokinase
MDLFGAVEAGGTKFICAVGDATGKILRETRIETGAVDETLPLVVEFITRSAKDLNGKIQRTGIGSFGPLDLNPTSLKFGFITSTPKPGWSNVDLLGYLRTELECPSVIDTDVNAAVYAEYLWGAGKGLHSLVYFTIGTGIGGGALINGRPLHGLVHPEMGHIILDHNLELDPFPGNCPYHKDCFEGLATGPAIQKRWNMKPEDIPSGHPAWDLEAWYIARALHSVITILSPERIILGGGVMQKEFLFPLICAKTVESLNGYVVSDSILKDINNFIVPPALGTHAGILGSLALAIYPPN